MEPSAPIHSKLSAGVQAVRDSFDEEGRKRIIAAQKLDYSTASVALSQFEYAPHDVEIAIIIAGMERSNVGEVGTMRVIEQMRVKWPDLEKQWFRNLRKAVQSILRSEGIADDARGLVHNIVNQDDFLKMCSYALEQLEEENRIDPSMFRYGTELACISSIREMGTSSIEILSYQKLKARLNLVSPFKKSVGDGSSFQGVSIPDEVAQQLYVHDMPLPYLRAIVRAPVFDSDKRLINTRGFHKSAGIYYAPPEGLYIPDLPRRISTTDLAEARRILVEELLGDFMFDGVDRTNLLEFALNDDPNNPPPPASMLNAIGFLLEQFARPLISGPIMPILVTKPLRGAGASLLVKAMQTVVEGKTSSRVLTRNEDERRKAAFTALQANPGIIYWDNVAGAVDSQVLASLFSEPTFTDRILGRSAERELPVRCSFAFSGNRPLFSEELRRRLNLININPMCSNPEEREGFRHENLIDWVSKNRGTLIWSCLVLIQNWIEKGAPKPRHAPTIGSFESYTYVIGGILEAASPNWISWQNNRHELQEISSDEEESDIQNLVESWWAQTGLRNSALASELADLALSDKINLPLKRVQNGEEFEYSSRALGNYLKSHKQRVFALEDGTQVSLNQQKRSGAGMPWKLVKVEQTSEPHPPRAQEVMTCARVNRVNTPDKCELKDTLVASASIANINEAVPVANPWMH